MSKISSETILLPQSKENYKYICYYHINGNFWIKST